MGAEIGATTSMFPYDANTGRVPAGHRRARRSPTRPTRSPATCAADPEVEADPSAYFDQVIEIDLATLRAAHQRARHPGPGPSGRRRRRVGARRTACRPTISAALIGSCTNSSYQDITRAAVVARQARGARAARPRRRCSSRRAPSRSARPSSATACSADLEAIGATVLANACGPCIGQWDRHGRRRRRRSTRSSRATTATSPKRNDGSARHQGLRDLAGDGDRLRAGRHPRVRPADRHHRRDGARVASTPPVGIDLPARRLRSGYRRLPSRRPTTRRMSRSWSIRTSRTAAAARAVPRVGRPRLHRPARAAEGEGQVHHRPHLRGRQVAHLPRPPREHLGQPLRWA